NVGQSFGKGWTNDPWAKILSLLGFVVLGVLLFYLGARKDANGGGPLTAPPPNGTDLGAVPNEPNNLPPERSSHETQNSARDSAGRGPRGARRHAGRRGHVAVHQPAAQVAGGEVQLQADRPVAGAPAEVVGALQQRRLRLLRLRRRPRHDQPPRRPRLHAET